MCADAGRTQTGRQAGRHSDELRDGPFPEVVLTVARSNSRNILEYAISAFQLPCATKAAQNDEGNTRPIWNYGYRYLIITDSV